MKLVSLVLLGSIAATPALAVTAIAPQAIRIIDGDSIMLNNTTRVRAVGYDTPEVRGKCAKEKELAALATKRLTELLKGPGKVATMKWSKGKDAYGRGLARLYSNHQNVGPILISEGLARPLAESAIRRGATHDWCKFAPSGN